MIQCRDHTTADIAQTYYSKCMFICACMVLTERVAAAVKDEVDNLICSTLFKITDDIYTLLTIVFIEV